MLGITVLIICVLLPLVILLVTKDRRSQGPRKTSKQTMLYAPGSTDIAAEAYHSPRKDSTMPFPLGKKQKRKKTETFRRHADD